MKFFVVTADNAADSKMEGTDAARDPDANVKALSDLDVEDLEKSLNENLVKNNNVGWWSRRRRRSYHSQVRVHNQQHIHNQPIYVHCG